MTTCASCGESGNPDDARFCAQCGTPLLTTTAAPAPSQPEPAPYPSEEPLAEVTGAAGSLVVSVETPSTTDSLPAPPVTGGALSREARYWAIAAHASALVGGFLGGIPAFLGPLVVWLIRKDEDAWSAGHGRDALNFNLSVIVYGLCLLLLSIVTLGIGLLIAIPGWICLALGWFAMTIVGAIRAAGDQPCRYPLTIRFVK